MKSEEVWVRLPHKMILGSGFFHLHQNLLQHQIWYLWPSHITLKFTFLCVFSLCSRCDAFHVEMISGAKTLECFYLLISLEAALMKVNLH